MDYYENAIPEESLTENERETVSPFLFFFPMTKKTCNGAFKKSLKQPSKGISLTRLPIPKPNKGRNKKEPYGSSHLLRFLNTYVSVKDTHQGSHGGFGMSPEDVPSPLDFR